MTNNLIIVGSGPAAWTAAIYAGRAALSPIVLAGEQGGGQLMLTTKVENYSGFPEGIMGPELMAAMRQQAERQGVTIIDKDAVSLSVIGSRFSVVSSGSAGFQSASQEPINRLTDQPTNQKPKTENGKLITANSVIIATGAAANTLKLPGEDRLMGRGVGTCAVCDAPLYRGKDIVLVIGGGDSAAEEAGELAKFVKKVVIVVRKDAMRASAVMHNRIKGLQNVEIWYKSEVKEFLGEKRLEKTRIVREGKEEVLTVDGAFYAIGHTPTTGWLAGSGVETDEEGYIKTKINNLLPTMTSLPGVFAAGDCVDPRYRQAITAAGYGCMAALDAQKWLENALMR